MLCGKPICQKAYGTAAKNKTKTEQNRAKIIRIKNNPKNFKIDLDKRDGLYYNLLR